MSNGLIKQALLGAVAIACLIATPAMARSRHEPIHHHAAGLNQDAARAAFASTIRRHSPNPAWDVYSETGTYLGSDPDSRIREQLAWDYTE
jgi:hypothetical protein